MFDADDLKAAADAHQRRLRGPLWNPRGHEEPPSGSTPPTEPGAPVPTDADPLPGPVHRTAPPPSAVPDWLSEAAGNPRTYDAPDPARVGVYSRLLPSTRAAARGVQTRFGLRTAAGTWEFLMRLGLAAADRLPAMERGRAP